MAFSKSNLYPKELQLTSHFCSAFSHPARLKILEQLSDEIPTQVELIRKEHPITQPTLSGHLEMLREAHFLTWQENFPHTFYKVDKQKLIIAEKKIINYFNLILRK